VTIPEKEGLPDRPVTGFSTEQDQLPDGALISMAEQDRRLWDEDAIDEGIALVTPPPLLAARRAVPVPGGERGCPR